MWTNDDHSSSFFKGNLSLNWNVAPTPPNRVFSRTIQPLLLVGHTSHVDKSIGQAF
jgi:hypothetical protein